MSTINLEAYYTMIEMKMGKTPAEFKNLAAEKGYLENGLAKPISKHRRKLSS